MKLTTNYIVYLNADNKVQCAKCRNSGKFVKCSIVQLEYENEYNYFNVSMLTMFILFTIMYLSTQVNKLENMMSNVSLSLANVLSHFSNGKTVVLFTHSNTYLFNSKVGNEKELTNLLNTGEVKTGRVL